VGLTPSISTGECSSRERREKENQHGTLAFKRKLFRFGFAAKKH
jgi:hypothetical protein